MKILYHPELSMRSYGSEPKWQTASDAQLTKMLACVDALPEEWEWLWLMPELYQCHPLQGPYIKRDDIEVTRVPWGDNVQEARFFFPIREMKAVLTAWEPDVVVLETPEHVQSWKLTMERTGYHCPVIASWQHVNVFPETDVPVDYMMRQLEGYLHADARVFPLESWKLVLETMAFEYGQGMGIKVAEDSEMWPGLYSPREVEENGTEYEGKRDKTTIFFIGRLSDNQRTHWEEFAEATRNLAAKRDDFVVWVANPNESQSPASFPTTFGNYQEHPFGSTTLHRRDYLDLLWRSDIVPFLYPMDIVYSIGFSEAVTASNLILTQESDDLKLNEAMACLVTDPNKVSNIENALLGMIEMLHEDGEWRTKALDEQEKWMFEERSVEENIESMKQTIERVTG